MPTPSRSALASRAVALAALIAVAALAGWALVLDVVIARMGESVAVGPGWASATPALLFAITGFVLMRRAPWHPIATMLLVIGVLVGVESASAATVNHAAVAEDDLPLAKAAFYINERFGAGALFAVPVLLLFLPDGRLPAARAGRALAVAAMGVLASVAAALALAPWHRLRKAFGNPDERITGWADPSWGLELPPSTWDAILAAAPAAGLVGVGLSVVVLAGRWHGADLERKRQLRWIVWAGSVFAACYAVGQLGAPYLIAQLLLSAGTAAVCAAVLFSVSRHRLSLIDGVLSWTVVYGLLLGAVVTVDVVLVAAVGSLVEQPTTAIISVVVVFLAYAPLRERVLGFAHTIVNGRRGDPYGLVSGLARRLEDADEADHQLAHVARTVASAFATPYVGVWVQQPGGEWLSATHGARTAEFSTLPLHYRGETIGRIELAPGRRRSMSPRDERLLADLVRHAAAAIRATTASEELQLIRERLVRAHEDERHRLRRELHDGLGPTLAGVTMRVDAAKNLAFTAPQAASELLETVAEEVADAVDEVRRLSHDLRPPVIDDLGLVRALELQSERFSTDGFRVRFSGDAPPLPHAAEVAVYRMASEALTNARRHSGAAHVDVLLRHSADALVLEITDDGRGIAADARPGIGLRSMRERAEELGGSLVISQRPGGGTTIRAELPLVDRPQEAAHV